MNGTHKEFYKLIGDLRAEQKLMEFNAAQVETGEMVHKRKKQAVLDARIKSIVSRYNSDDIPKYFRRLAPNLKKIK